MNPSVDISSHRRRLPAHLSVSLKHGGSIPANRQSSTSDPSSQQDKNYVLKASQAKKSSGESNASSNEANVDKWFDRSSKRPPNVVLPDFEDNEPPYFIPPIGSNIPLGDSNQLLQPSYAPYQDISNRAHHHGTADSSADDYRSVIDDLTIENKKLREKLRKYEKFQSSHLDKDRLFEVKIHALPPAKRKELEHTLRSFASTIDESSEGVPRSTSRTTRARFPARLPTHGSDGTKNASSSSTSNSRPVDSAYASMSHSGPTSTGLFHQRGKLPTQASKEQNIHLFLHDIPEGLLPKHPLVMTERQKKKLVVRRLEQLFTGRVRGLMADHSQSLQQQEVSKSAARAEQPGQNRYAEEGLREANILPHEMELDRADPSTLSNQSSTNTISPVLSRSWPSPTPNRASSPDQRPTRPLDLDPDREQIPQDNVDYIRHLGLSTPQLVTEDSSDAEPDADGWIYLNLLINMAQLHIMNVTPDFVRSAVSNVSAKFQLSPDGKKLRWRGGKEGTRLSDSDHSSPSAKRSHESDDGSGKNSKRRKTEGSWTHTGRFASMPVEPRDPAIAPNESALNSFHYKPLFHHQTSRDSGVTLDESASNSRSSPENMSRVTGTSRRWHRSRSGRASDGPIVFYSGAKFCTDLSSDSTNIITPLHTMGVDNDGYSSHAQNALGCQISRPTSTFSRTPSGSLMRSRPFKDYPVFGGSGGSSSPELLTSDDSMDEEQLEMNLEWSSKPSQVSTLLELRASGLGGTQPADHFAVSVQTRRSKLKAGSKIPRIERRQRIPRASLDIFREAKNKQLADDIAERLASLNAFSPQPQVVKKALVELLAVRTEILKVETTQLRPSELPEPTSYYESMSSSDGGSDSEDSSSSGLSLYRRPFRHRTMNSLSNPDIRSPQAGRLVDKNIETDEDLDEDDDGTDSSIDMLAHLRAVNPEVVAAQEYQFDMEVDQPAKMPAPSISTVAGQISSSDLTDESDVSDDDVE